MRPFCILLFLAAAIGANAQHAHVNAGASSTNQDAQLYFVNGANFVTNSGYVVSLVSNTEPRFEGLYAGTITFTALAATEDLGGPAFGHAAPGSVLELQMVSARGPTNGVFGFWEQFDPAPRMTIETGETNGTNMFLLSESSGAPGEDPFGHVHGREFSATEPGLYAIGFRIVDTSQNGAGGGPIHRPSDIFHLYFQAGVTITEFSPGSSGATVDFGTRSGSRYWLEAISTDFSGTNVWSTVAGPISGNNRFLRLTDPQPVVGELRFYRIRESTP